MRWLPPLALVVALAAPGCRVTTDDGPDPMRPIDPTDPSALPACPAGPHVSIAVRLRDSRADHAILRLDSNLEPCQGTVLPRMQFGSPTAIGGLPDGREVLGLGGYNSYGDLAVLNGNEASFLLEDQPDYPTSFAMVNMGQATLAILWGSSSSGSGERLFLVEYPGLVNYQELDASYEHRAVGGAPSGQSQRLSLMQAGEGLQELRMDPGAASLATTGELQVAVPGNGSPNNLDVVDGRAVAAVPDGVVYWERGTSNAFLGPVRCVWPATTDTRLPNEGDDYLAALVHGEQMLALVDGGPEGSEDETGALYLMTRRGECTLIGTIPDSHAPVSMTWVGR